jgi:hypothetical protein
VPISAGFPAPAGLPAAVVVRSASGDDQGGEEREDPARSETATPGPTLRRDRAPRGGLAPLHLAEHPARPVGRKPHSPPALVRIELSRNQEALRRIPEGLNRLWRSVLRSPVPLVYLVPGCTACRSGLSAVALGVFVGAPPGCRISKSRRSGTQEPRPCDRGSATRWGSVRASQIRGSVAQLGTMAMCAVKL